MILGICGPYASGKSTLAHKLKSIGFHHIDLDKLGHQALVMQKKVLVDIFGRAILDSSENISRSFLASQVFNCQKERLKLESIVHPWMKKEVFRIIAEYQTSHNVLIEGSLLFYMDLDSLCTFILFCYPHWYQRLIWSIQRGKHSLKLIIKIFFIQRKLNLRRYSKKSKCILIR